MAHEYKLILALPQSAPGLEELHYGRMCKVKGDGVYVELNEQDANIYLRGGRIVGPVVPDEPTPEPIKVEPEVSKRKRRTKAEIEKDEAENLKNLVDDL